MIYVIGYIIGYSIGYSVGNEIRLLIGLHTFIFLLTFSASLVRYVWKSYSSSNSVQREKSSLKKKTTGHLFRGMKSHVFIGVNL